MKILLAQVNGTTPVTSIAVGPDSPPVNLADLPTLSSFADGDQLLTLRGRALYRADEALVAAGLEADITSLQGSVADLGMAVAALDTGLSSEIARAEAAEAALASAVTAALKGQLEVGFAGKMASLIDPLAFVVPITRPTVIDADAWVNFGLARQTAAPANGPQVVHVLLGGPGPDPQALGSITFGTASIFDFTVQAAFEGTRTLAPGTAFIIKPPQGGIDDPIDPAWNGWGFALPLSYSS